MIANILVGIFAMSVGTISLLAGNLLFRFLLPLLGFLIGFAAGAGFGELLFGGGTVGILLAGLAGLVLGIVLAGLSYYLYTFGVLLLAVFVGAAIFASVTLTLGFDSVVASVTALVGGLVLALLTLFFNLQGMFIALLTSAIGAAGILVGLAVLLGKVPVSVVGTGEAIGPLLEGSFIASLLWIVLFVAGAAVQTLITAPDKIRRGGEAA
jgi:hypothetical protein